MKYFSEYISNKPNQSLIQEINRTNKKKKSKEVNPSSKSFNKEILNKCQKNAKKYRIIQKTFYEQLQPYFENVKTPNSRYNVI